jgi:hypothetical protein
MSEELVQLVLQVLRSWQVITVTLVLIAYFFLVFYVARLYRPRRKAFFSPRPKRPPKPKKEEAPAEELEIEE